MIGVDKTSVDKVIASAIFDLEFYQAQAGRKFENKEAAATHFLNEGHLYKLSPHPLFDTLFYLQLNDDIAKAGVNPLLHYINQGGFEGRNPSQLFHSQYYLKENPDVASSRINPLTHYLLHGGFEGRNPSLNFESALYLRENDDVRASKVNPLVHYVLKGYTEGRRPNSKPVTPKNIYLAMRALEPMIPPFEALHSMRESKESFISETGKTFAQLCEQVASKFSHLIVCNAKAANLDVVENILEAAQRATKQSLPLIIFTGSPDKNFESKLQDKSKLMVKACAGLFCLQKMQPKITTDEEIKIICRLAIQAEPRAIHAIDSETAFVMFRRLYKPLSIKSKLYATLPALEFDNENVLSGSNLLLSPCADSLTTIFVENKAISKAVIEQVGFDKNMADRFVVCNRQSTDSYVEALEQAGYFA